MASRDEIFQVLADVLQKEFGFETGSFRPETHLVDDLDLDSIDAIDLAVRLEERTGVAFRDEELKAIRTLGDVVDLIDGRG
ncbi:acyl carrier protein [Myxococcota bacterium]|nr:acyl carrier protein [Myxococcota bacterium]MCZ7616929.1 acyl carrier protein [Myxococcota bacterium]